MKYIKTYENNTEPQIGDYAIVKDSTIRDTNDVIHEFLMENIGKIIKIDYSSHFPFLIKFQNVPYELNDRFRSERIGRRVGKRDFSESEMIAFSPNKKDLEVIISANKYNL
jgi:hypothetical protein